MWLWFFDLKTKFITSDKTLIKGLWEVFVYNMVKPKVEILLASFFAFILFSFVTIGNEFSTPQSFLDHVWNKFFRWKISTWLKVILKTLEITPDRGLALQLYEATKNFAPIGVLFIFDNQCIMAGFFCIVQLF